MKLHLTKKIKFSLLRAKTILIVFCFLLLCSNAFCADNQQESEEKTIITILNSLKTRNEKNQDTGEDLIVFEGSVKISVEKGETKTVISADEITYNRKHEMLYAVGNVELEQKDKSGSVSSITASNVLFNTSSLEGIFDDGRIVQEDTNALNMPTGSTLVVGSDIFARNNSGTIAFKKAELTFCNDKHPHWKIKASRIWLLPGNEFAFFNAVLFLDNIPVLYLPAFYYPKDELIFNPVFGYKNRLGFFIQTTTYLYGRKPLEPTETTSSTNGDDDVAKYFNFIKPTKLMDQELQGIVLHNLDTVYTGDTSNYLKFMGDWYSNLGFGVGLDGKFKPTKIFTTLEGNVFLGFGNSIYQSTLNPSIYLPYDASGNKNYQTSDFLGVKIPFRYKAGFKIGISQPFNLTLSMPIFSDPLFNYDYGDRSESMDWFSYLLNNPLAENSSITEEQKRDAAEVTSFSWDLNGSYSVPLPDVIKPYIETISISSFNSSVSFASKTKSDNLNPLSQNSNKFFFPSLVTPIKLSGSISGTIFSTNKRTTSSSSKKATFPVDLIKPLEITSNSEAQEKQKQESNINEEVQQNQTLKDTTTFDFERDGLGKLDFSNPTNLIQNKELNVNINYSINPDFGTQFSYSPVPLNTGGDFDWNQIQSSYIYVKVPVSITDTLSWKNDFISMSNTLNFSPSYQTHPYLSTDVASGGYTTDNINSIKKTDYTSSIFEITNSNRISIKPFAYYSIFKNSGISYNTAIKFFRTKFIGDAENPEWDKLTVDFDDPDSITTHSLDFSLSASELGGDFSQSLIITSTLPPQIAKYYGTLRFDFPYVTLTGEAGVRQKSKDDKTWTKEQIKQGLTISLFENKMKFSQSFNYDAENNRPDALKFSLSWEGLQLAYTMQHSQTYDFNQGWISKNEEKFVPYSASIAYSTSSKNFRFWKNRISIAPTLSTSLVVDFVRPTNSYFIFSPGISFKVNEFLDFSFSTTSRNDVLYRYVQTALGYPGRLPGEENIFRDLLNGFRFDDENIRKSSGFKLKSLNFTITHDLHDWDLKCDFKIEPRLITSPSGMRSYDFSPYFSISVIWRPMESIKTEVLDEYGTWQLN